MKIENITQLTSAKTPREGGRGEAATSTSSGVEEASTNVRLLRQPSADSSQDIDTVRVEELRQAIAEGRLEIRAEKIADGLIESLHELLKP